jgi:hypothetical protein
MISSDIRRGVMTVLAAALGVLPSFGASDKTPGSLQATAFDDRGGSLEIVRPMTVIHKAPHVELDFFQRIAHSETIRALLIQKPENKAVVYAFATPAIQEVVVGKDRTAEVKLRDGRVFAGPTSGTIRSSTLPADSPLEADVRADVENAVLTRTVKDDLGETTTTGKLTRLVFRGSFPERRTRPFYPENLAAAITVADDSYRCDSVYFVYQYLYRSERPDVPTASGVLAHSMRRSFPSIHVTFVFAREASETTVNLHSLSELEFTGKKTEEGYLELALRTVSGTEYQGGLKMVGRSEKDYARTVSVWIVGSTPFGCVGIPLDDAQSLAGVKVTIGKPIRKE